MKHVFPINEDAYFKRANDMRLSPLDRSRNLHELMDYAKDTGDPELWIRIGMALIRARELDDLSIRVSDRFVELCPDESFKKVAKKGPRRPFYAWHDRARRLHVWAPQISDPVHQ